MRVLGIGDGFGAGAAFVEDGRVRYAISEERLSRIKNHSGYYHGFPDRSIAAGLAFTGWDPASVDQIAISNFAFPPLPLRLLALHRARPVGDREFLDRHEFSQTLNSRLYSLFSERDSESTVGRASVGVYRRALARKLERQAGLEAPIVFVDHHRCHAASAYYTQPRDDCLIVTMDCHGDGLSGTVSTGEGGRIRRVASFPAVGSLGSFYAAITNHLGFHHHRHEGKVTGLAAYGDPSVADADMRRIIHYDRAKRRLVSQLGRNQFTAIARIGGLLSRDYGKEDLAAAAQSHFERIVLEILEDFLGDTGKRHLALAGGLFGNVKLNQRINCMDAVDSLFVHPGMGDEGLPVGAALAMSAARAGHRFERIDNVYWGEEVRDADVEKALASYDFRVEKPDCIEERVAELLAAKKIVARCAGRMEYGPRALGNRSILFHAGDPTANDWLNHALQRTEFMPFAPSVLQHRAEDCFERVASAAYSAEFMTVCFDCKPDFARDCPTVVHVDGTARPQLVNAASHPDYFRILEAYEARTGFPAVVNTSFNIHEEPIVCTPDDALRAFATARLDHLALGSYLVTHPAGERPG